MRALLDLFALVGVTIIVTRGTIFARPRRLWPLFFECPLCVGFWVGLLAGVLDTLHERASWSWWTAWTFVTGGAVVAIMSLIVDAWLVSRLGERE